MAHHNQNGERSTLAGDGGSSWRPQDPSPAGTRGREAEDDRGDYRSWRDRSFRDERRAGEREPRRWETGRRGDLYEYEDRDPPGRSTGRYGQGRSGYGAGRQGDDRSQQVAGPSGMPSPGSFEDRYREDRYRDLGTDDRFTGRGRTGHDLDRYAGQVGHDFEAERRGLSHAGYGHGYGERTGYPASSYGRGSTGYDGSAAQDMPPRHAGPEPHVHRGTGPHRGKGPSGYQRSDERIRELVCESLADDDQVDATNIEVAVSHGEVTLSGPIEDRRAKRDAEDCAWSVSGVRDVQNRLRVVRDDRSIRTSSPSDPPSDLSSTSPSNPSGQAPVGRNETDTAVQDRKYRA